MGENNILIGKIVKLDGLSIIVEITEKGIADRITIKMGVSDFVVSVGKLIYSALPNGKKVICRITTIYDKNLFANQNIFNKSDNKFILEAELTGIYDDFLKKIDYGINTFPIIGSQVYSATETMYNDFFSLESDYLLRIGQSNIRNLPINANPDILLGKHLGVFGNTGAGKTCTIASLIQGLKRRLHDKNNFSVGVTPKIIIFDSNKEYSSAFDTDEFSIKTITKNELFLPHYYLNFTEYYKFVGASNGVQAPTLKSVIKKLRNCETREDDLKFDFFELPEGILRHIREQVTNDYQYNQWFSWNSTMIHRIEAIIEDESILSIINPEGVNNTVNDIIEADEEIIIIEADFDKDELDIIMFLFSKLLYENCTIDKATTKENHIVILLEEAHRYLNDNDKDNYRLGSYYIERLAREGRKFGISLIVSSQRPSELSKTVVSQCNSFIIHKITNKFDLDFVYRILDASNKDLLKYVPGLENQHAIVSGEAFGSSNIIKVESAFPLPDSNDPEVIESWKDL